MTRADGTWILGVELLEGVVHEERGPNEGLQYPNRVLARTFGLLPVPHERSDGPQAVDSTPGRLLASWALPTIRSLFVTHMNLSRHKQPRASVIARLTALSPMAGCHASRARPSGPSPTPRSPAERNRRGAAQELKGRPRPKSTPSERLRRLARDAPYPHLNRVSVGGDWFSFDPDESDVQWTRNYARTDRRRFPCCRS